MNSAFSARWLASSELISQALFTSEHGAARETLKIDYFYVNWYRYSSFGLYLFNLFGKTSIFTSMSVNSGRYLPSPQRIIVNYWAYLIKDQVERRAPKQERQVFVNAICIPQRIPSPGNFYTCQPITGFNNWDPAIAKHVDGNFVFLRLMWPEVNLKTARSVNYCEC